MKRSDFRIFKLLVITVVMAACFVVTASATACTRVSLPDIEDEVMCVVCKTPLNVSEAPQAERERVLIRQLIDDCKSKDQIKTELRRQYGASVLAVPSTDGFNLTVWLVPIVAFALALIAIVLKLKLNSGQAKPKLSTSDNLNFPEPNQDELDRLTEELKEDE